MQTFDMILIGTGAGPTVAFAASAKGMKVAVVEEGPFGGVCVNRGCIPSKMLIRSADVADTVRRAHEWGIAAEIRGIDWQTIVSSVSETIDGWSADGERASQNDPNQTVFKGHARFVGEKTLEVNGEQIRADTVVIAAGGRPFVPPVPGLEGTPYLTSDNALRLMSQPRRLVVIGGGSVAAELAHFFGGLGTDVTIVERGPMLLGGIDADVAKTFTEVYKRGFDVRLDTNLMRVDYANGVFSLELEHDGATTKLDCDSLLVATGRVPNTDTLNVAATGVELNEGGFIRTDEYLETSVRGIWALGDITGNYMLRHNSNLEASYVAHNVLNYAAKQPADHHGMPFAVFASPQVGGVGLTEGEARKGGRKVRVGRGEYSDVTYGISLHDRDGFIKVIADAETREVLGCHIIGTDASILTQEVANVVRQRQTTDSITQAIYIHPALPEVVQKAFLRCEAADPS
ncbi:MAG TPA: FAD-dependent oxidoreductase [Dehalococcoidia bacterium]|nr:FAD-dependent oxidoreductase [Dehalococcoidia bacterium]